ncbi:MAG TPA: hypothetical protein ENN41_00450 [Sediminispirochaeta sp.]|nr:hypothetical protein [Sediminispirochaeta sp.]
MPREHGKALSAEDRHLLDTVGSIARAIARQFGEYCEVVVHSLEDFERSIIEIENGEITGRQVGGPVTDFALSLLEKEDDSTVHGPYFSKTDTGRHLKSTTTVINNKQREAVGFLCINFDISAPFAPLMESLLSGLGGGQMVTEHFPLTAKDLVEGSFREALQEVSQMTGVSPTQKNKMVVEELYKRGVFHVKNGIDIVAEKLGISRYTIYNYIREVKTVLGENEIEKSYP